jgi:hypothetical protein
MARWRGLRSDFLDLVTTNLLGAIDLSDASERAAGVALLRAAAGNEVLCHLWASWLPGEPGLRVSLVSEAHVAFLHTSALFLANTTRNVSGEDSLYTVLLETGCAECETIALRRLHELRGAIAPLAEAILDRNATVVHRELQRALGFSLLHEARQRLRRSLIDVAARWMGVRVDESAFAWARQLEGTGLVDNGNEWHLRRP